MFYPAAASFGSLSITQSDYPARGKPCTYRLAAGLDVLILSAPGAAGNFAKG